MTKVLEFGPQEEALSGLFFPNADITIKPMKGAWWEIEGDWDGIFSYYNLTMVPFPIEQEVLTQWTRRLNEDGLLYVTVPSWEYMSRMALQERLAIWLKPIMFNAVNQFTMKSLRVLFHKAGLSVISAKTGEGHMVVQGQDVVLEQHFLTGRKK